MKQILLLIIMIPAMLLADSPEIEQLIMKGIELHDKGDYEEALEIYEEALEINPYSALAMAEMSITYYMMEEYEKSIEIGKKAIEIDDRLIRAASMSVGNSMDMLGQTEESIEFFEDIIDDHGGDFMTHYNLAVNYSKLEEWEEVEENSITAIRKNPTHSSSHALLAVSQLEQGERIPAILSYSHFLMIEPNTQRSFGIAQDFERLLLRSGHLVSEAEDGSISISIVERENESDFSTAEMTLSFMSSMVSAPITDKLEEEAKEESEKTKGDRLHMMGSEKDPDDKEQLKQDITSLFTFLITILEDDEEHEDNIWREYYIPFYSSMKEEGHLETHGRLLELISMDEEKATAYIDEHREEIEEYFNWVRSKMQ